MTVIHQTTIDTIATAYTAVITNNTTLSYSNPVFEVSVNGSLQILKIIPKYNVSSVVQPTLLGLQSHQAWGVAIPTYEHDMVIPTIKSIKEWDDCFSFIMPRLQLVASDFSYDFRDLVRAVKRFHIVATPLAKGLVKLPWHNFSPEFVDAMEQNGREAALLDFLNTHTPHDSMSLVVCHNDLHPGNVYRYQNKVCLIDFGESAIASPLNDLGILLANYLVRDDMTPVAVVAAAKRVLDLYDATATADSLQDCLLYAARKLFCIEAYFSYISLHYSRDSQSIIESLRKRQAMVMESLEVVDASR